MKSFIDRKGQTTTFGYDGLKRKVSAVYADGGAVRYRYDAVGRLMEVDDSESGTIAYEYATFGQCRGCSGKASVHHSAAEAAAKNEKIYPQITQMGADKKIW